jgi:hypothetical protein
MPKGVEHHRLHRSPDELDGLLRAYFRAEMPDPWPSAPGGPPPRRVPAPAWHRFRRHLALAAAIGFFLVGSFLLTRSYPDIKEQGKGGFSEPKSILDLAQDPKKRPANPGKIQEGLPEYKAPPPVLQQFKGPTNGKVLPLEMRGQDRSWGFQRGNGDIILNAVSDRKSP